MTKWEYKFHSKEFESANMPVEAWFNELGEEGWEIINVKSSFNADYTTCFYFVIAKRPKPDV